MSDTWTGLLEAHGAARHRGRDDVPAHAPIAAIVACSDARVPPSVIFDQPAGRLFVVRTAGNTATPATVASLDYAVDELGVGLIVVLGHSSCGAVTAAADGHCGGHLGPITDPICRLATDHPEYSVAELTEKNVETTMAGLRHGPSPVGRAVRSGRVELTGAVYDLVADRVIPIAATN